MKVQERFQRYSCAIIIRSFYLQTLQEWSQATSVARAFAIGKGEAMAVVNIMGPINSKVVDKLESAVRVRGMARFLSHDVLGQKLLNEGQSSGALGMDQWKEQMRNGTDNKLVPRLQYQFDLTMFGVLSFVTCLNMFTSCGLMFGDNFSGLSFH